MADFPQLTEEDYGEIRLALDEFIAKSEASMALLVEKAGYLIHRAGEEICDATLLASLSSNSFNAVHYMADQLLGESNFPGLYQQGERRSTLVLNVDENCILVVVFQTVLSAGMVKYFAQPAILRVAEQLTRARNRTPEKLDLASLDLPDATALFQRKTGESPQ